MATRVYIYVVARDFGFAPNPFHGYCTLATCKPKIRDRADVSDWVIGVGGTKLKATGRCIYAMQITEIITFDQYWSDPRFLDKRPVRNGSSKMLVGDNIYHRDSSGTWQQEDSHHSEPDGSPNTYNLQHDTRVNRVLISDRFLYFGKECPLIPDEIIQAMHYTNVRDYRVYDQAKSLPLQKWLNDTWGASFNTLLGDPSDFHRSYERYDVQADRIHS